MRRILVLLAIVALLVAMYASAALAKIITGDAGNNHLIESPGADTLNGRRGNDLLDAGLWGGYTGRADRDVLKGGRQSDVLVAADGLGRGMTDNRDFLIGGKGAHDRCIGDPGDTYAGSCEKVTKIIN